jgi:hypothetical protein
MYLPPALCVHFVPLSVPQELRGEAESAALAQVLDMFLAQKEYVFRAMEQGRIPMFPLRQTVLQPHARPRARLPRRRLDLTLDRACGHICWSRGDTGLGMLVKAKKVCVYLVIGIDID